MFQRSARRRTGALTRMVALSAAVAATFAGAQLSQPQQASAHGSATDPPSRNYGCWDRWADDFQSPEMADEDPMCWQAWQDNPNAMWNWNGLYLNGVNGDHQGAVPDGQLCSAGRDRYAALDEVGPWKAVTRDNQFSVTVTDQAEHGADYYKVYITEQGFDPTTQRLGWDDLELVTEVGERPPATTTTIDVDAGDRTGRHIVYTIWQAAHMDQSYYFCSDVRFTGN
ncbi:lytic polysaccharide monooxygenase auxiliary activity family 9 protein [Actinopolyspora mortivallis]|uniref:lytic polysaccharide monooxygenase auxiliary activity family 9 protein n=1 Tax=Actinopolyspora mortivallis TaxID=33906 RepID=UPI0003791E2E|nr:lytic polysaccharide monooxygenase auxiliary activity family 9 protein [Actinopolyspora mortivallis]